jgi:membrane protein required for colicin V production
MQTYDALMLVVLIGTTMFGFWKGMAWQIASLASLVVSYYAALRFSTQLAPIFGEHAPLNRFVAMLAIYIATSFVIWMIFRLVSQIIDRVKLESFDRQLGAMLGLAKGVLLCVAITFFAVTLLPPAQGEAIVATTSGRYIVALLNKTHSVVPPELHEVIDPYLNGIEQRLGSQPQPHAQNMQGLWPQGGGQQPPASTAWPSQGQSPWPQSPAQPQWHTPSNSSDPAWPTETQPPAGSPADAYRAGGTTTATRETYPPPREPNPFPGADGTTKPVGFGR